MISLLVSIAVMLVIVGACMRWAVREQRRRTWREEGHARHH